MSSKRSNTEDVNVTKRRIPLHYQKRYMATFNNGSFNTSFVTAMYKQKIKTLIKNNKMLALALQNDRINKEALLAESKANANLIMFSRLKFASISENLRAALTELDETVLLLKQHSSSCLANLIPKNTMCSKEFKNLIKEVSTNIMPEIDERSPLNLSKQQSPGYLLDIGKQKKNSGKEFHPTANKKRKLSSSKVDRKANKIDAKIQKKSHPLQNMDNCLKESNRETVSDENVLNLSMKNSEEKAESNKKQNDETVKAELIEALPNMPIIERPTEKINIKSNFDYYQINTDLSLSKNIQVVNENPQYANVSDINKENDKNKKSQPKAVSKAENLPNANYHCSNLTDVNQISNVNKKPISNSILKPRDNPKANHQCVNLIGVDQVSGINTKSTLKAVPEPEDMHKTNHQCTNLTGVNKMSKVNNEFILDAVSKQKDKPEARHPYVNSTVVGKASDLNTKSTPKNLPELGKMRKTNHQCTNLTKVNKISLGKKKSTLDAVSKQRDKPQENLQSVYSTDINQVSDENTKSAPKTVPELGDMHTTNHQCANLTNVNQISELNKIFTTKAVSKLYNVTHRYTGLSYIEEVSAIDKKPLPKTVSKADLPTNEIEEYVIDKSFQPPDMTNTDELPNTNSLKYNKNVLIESNNKMDKGNSNISPNEKSVNNSPSELRKEATKQSKDKYVAFKHMALQHNKNKTLSTSNKNVSDSTDKENQIDANTDYIKSQSGYQIKEANINVPSQNVITNDSEKLLEIKTNSQQNIDFKEPKIILEDIFKNNKNSHKTVRWLDQKQEEFIDSDSQINIVDGAVCTIQIKENPIVECDSENSNGSCLFSVDELEESLSTSKRKSHRRHTTICYKEINLKKKLRR